MNFVCLSTVEDSFKARFLKEKLAEHDIPVILINENITGLIPNMYGMMGFGIQLLVPVAELGRAWTIIGLDRVINHPQCPECASTDIQFGLGTKTKYSRIVMIFLSALFVAPFGNIHNVYYCRQCGAEFNPVEDDEERRHDVET